LPNEYNFCVVFTEPLSEIELTKALCKGEEFAFSILFKRYYGTLCQFAFRYSQDKNKAEEIVSEVFIVIWQRHSSLSISVSLKSYLYACVRNSCLKKLKIDRKTDVELSDDFQEPSLNPFEQLQHKEVQHDLLNVIDLLPARCKEVFLLCKIDGLKHKEIAVLLEISERTVEQHMAHALEFLRRKLLQRKRNFN
jgi:RNA polymerase sigma-70 factor, ECF subfamily